MYKFEIELADPIISVATGKSGHIVQIDTRKVDPAVRAQLYIQGNIKPLTDISKDADETEVQWHERRLKRRDNWYNGDFTVRGGGTADPVAVQMKEELITAYMKAGKTRKEATAHVKGTAAAFLRAQALKRFPNDEGDANTWFDMKMESYRAKAEATLVALQKAAKAAPTIDLDEIEI